MALLTASAVRAQVYVPGETLNYRMSYKAKLFPNTEVAKVIIQTTEEKFDGKDMYMISPLGLEVSASLEDSILSVVRKQSLQTATRYLSLRRRGAFVKSTVTHEGQGRYVVSCLIEDSVGEIGSFRLTVPTEAIAEQIKRHFCKNPEEVIKGVTTAATGEVAYLLPGFADADGI